ncbi:hypothetical protein GCM10010102_08270 [Promicromonospora citrea]|uniref:Uncharacterized protein n=1 Tax=Promicromonospora citrea TaxID=43677 RepID=A0A8H9GFM9_9MICO|nr:hypothetical protein GCM10010102_08270 [Promicromonospora citrea]
MAGGSGRYPPAVMAAVGEEDRDARLIARAGAVERFFRSVGTGTSLVVVAVVSSLTVGVAVGTAASVVVCATDLAVASSLRCRDVSARMRRDGEPGGERAVSRGHKKAPHRT